MCNTGFFMRLSVDDLIREFKDFGRGNQFSSAALAVLHEHHEEVSEDIGEPLVLDVIAICCEWSELTVEEALDEYDCEDLYELQDNFTVLEVNYPEEDRVLVRDG